MNKNFWMFLIKFMIESVPNLKIYLSYHKKYLPKLIFYNFSEFLWTWLFFLSSALFRHSQSIKMIVFAECLDIQYISQSVFKWIARKPLKLYLSINNDEPFHLICSEIIFQWQSFEIITLIKNFVCNYSENKPLDVLLKHF